MESWLYLPAEPVLRAHAATIEDEIHRIARQGGPDEGELDEPPERVETERTDDPEDFVPVAADVAPQMNLFGEAGDASVQPIAAPVVAAEPEPERAAVPAFQRRKDLRAERHRLVSELARKRRCEPREANRWINSKIGIGKVDEATIDQLQRSCDLLVQELIRASRPRR
jgi:hypothetical protein